MPGEKIYSFKGKGNYSQGIKIDSVYLRSRSSITITLFDNKKISGVILSSYTFNMDWIKSRDVLRIKSKTSVSDIQVSKIKRITGQLTLNVLSENIEIDSSFTSWSLYDPNNNNETIQFSDKPRWIEPDLDTDDYSFDLFTPPILYMHEGKLLGRLPQQESEDKTIEPFGLTLFDVQKSEYDFKIAGWVGSTPYITDLKTENNPGSGNFVRNRVPIGQPHKRLVGRKQGQPSLVPCQVDDPERLIVVENFKVQKVKNEKTGGTVSIGRALVRDYQLGGESFEINSMMDKVYAGTLLFLFKTSLPGITSTTIEFNSKENGKKFEIGGRLYEITDINTKENKITVTKSDPRLSENTTQVFSYN